MRVITVLPGTPNSAQLDNDAEPPLADGSILVRAKALGICGTDGEIVAGKYGSAPAGSERLILGHESLGVVEEAPAGSPFARGDLVVGIVRRPDPVPCINCAVGEWDMCRNGLYTERGIKERHGYGAERYRIEPQFAVKVDLALGIRAVLLEPASVVAKAWEHIDRIGRRARWEPRCALITGAGPVGLLAALMAVQRGLTVHVFDRHRDGPKPGLARALGARYHTGELAALNFDTDPDIVVECTGASPVIVDAFARTAAGGIVCLAGVSSGGRTLEIDVGMLNRTLVLENNVVFGSVNANRRHYELAAAALAQADPAWLDRVIARRVPLARWPEALLREPDDVKTIIDFEA
jgi:threonine dehydrogenase-like Zn-dependent dehydrogenase